MVIIMQDCPYLDISDIRETISNSNGGMVCSYDVVYVNKKEARYPVSVVVEGAENNIFVYCTNLDHPNLKCGENALVNTINIDDLDMTISEYVEDSLARLNTEIQNHSGDLNAAFLKWYGGLVK